MTDFKIGSYVKVVSGGWGIADSDVEKLRGEIFEVVSYDPCGCYGEEGYLLKPSLLKRFEYVPGEDGFIGRESLEIAGASQTSIETPSFVEFLTSISVIRKTAMQSHSPDNCDVSKALYAQESTHISLDTEGDGAYIVIKQDNEDFNGHLQGNVIKLDIDEVEAVFSAIKKLTKQLGE